jgi:hypothetical protein
LISKIKYKVNNTNPLKAWPFVAFPFGSFSRIVLPRVGRLGLCIKGPFIEALHRKENMAN